MSLVFASGISVIRRQLMIWQLVIGSLLTHIIASVDRFFETDSSFTWESFDIGVSQSAPSSFGLSPANLDKNIFIPAD